MNVRCGSCRNQFEVAGPGRYACPVCGAVNVVREAAAPSSVGGYPAAPGAVPDDGVSQAPPPPPPAPPPPKLACPECAHEFYVGRIAKARCPNCDTEIETGFGDPEDDGE